MYIIIEDAVTVFLVSRGHPFARTYRVAPPALKSSEIPHWQWCILLSVTRSKYTTNRTFPIDEIPSVEHVKPRARPFIYPRRVFRITPCDSCSVIASWCRNTLFGEDGLGCELCLWGVTKHIRYPPPMMLCAGDLDRASADGCYQMDAAPGTTDSKGCRHAMPEMNLYKVKKSTCI